MDPITVAALIGAGAAILAPVVNYMLKRSSSQIDIKYQARVVIVGIGDTGKSTLIESIMAGENAGAGTITNRASQHEEVRSVPDEGGKYWSLLIVDYSGQNTQQLTRFLNENELQSNPPTVFVLMVDPFQDAPPNGNLDLDSIRVQSHLDEWSTAALQSMAGMLDGIRYVCLFVNKCDALSTQAETQIHGEFLQLFASLENIFPASRCERIEGSALAGTSVQPLIQNILESKRRLS